MAHQRRHGARHVRLHGAGAGARPAGRSSRRHVRLRRRALRDAQRRARVQGGNRRRHDDARSCRRSRRISTPRGLSISPGLDRIVRRCLEKSPELRFQSANDLAFALETLSSGSTSSATTVSPAEPKLARRASAGWIPWAIAAVAVLAAAASWLPRGTAPTDDGALGPIHRISEAAGEETSPSISPDGSTVAYSTRVNGSWDIYSPARRRPERDADRQRSAARRRRRRPSHRTDR